MANTYASSVLLEARAKLAGFPQEKFEQRKNLSKITPVFLEGQNMIPDLAAIKEAKTQETKIEYLKATDATLITTKSCAPSGEVGGSGIATVSWNQLGFVAKSNSKQHDGNEYKQAEALSNLLFQLEADFWWKSGTSMEALQYAYLEANRTTVNAISTSGVSRNDWVGAAAYTVDVTNANRDEFYNLALSDMQLNNYSGMINDVFNTGWGQDQRFWAAQGAGNSTNTQFQYQSGMFKYAPSNLIVPSGYYNSVHYLIPEGGVAMITWNDPQNRRRKVSGSNEWTTMQSRFFPGVTFDVFITEACADTTDDGGGKQDLVATYEIVCNYAFVKQPMTTGTPIFKYSVTTA
jgi:hypothetical protein